MKLVSQRFFQTSFQNLLALPQHQHTSFLSETSGQRKLVCWCWGRAKRLTWPSKNPKNNPSIKFTLYKTELKLERDPTTLFNTPSWTPVSTHYQHKTSHSSPCEYFLVLGSFVFPLYCHWREKGENRIMAKHEVRLLRFPWDNWHVVSMSVV